MTKPKKYGLKLVSAIKTFISVFSKKKPAKNTDYFSHKETANGFRINEFTFNKCMKGNTQFSIDNLFSLISMPTVTEKEAMCWIMLWLADQMDSYKVPGRKIFEKKNPMYQDYGIPFLDERHIPWTPNKQREQLDKWATSLDKLANYTGTLGIIDQIDLARKRQRNVIKNSGYVEEGYCVPDQGPNVSSIDFDKPCASKIKILQKRHEPRRSDKRQEPITALVLKFAKDLAELEAKNRITEVEEYQQDELIESYLEDEINRYNEEDHEIALTDLDLEVSKHVEAIKLADDIMAQFKSNRNNLES